MGEHEREPLRHRRTVARGDLPQRRPDRAAAAGGAVGEHAAVRAHAVRVDRRVVGSDEPAGMRERLERARAVGADAQREAVDFQSSYNHNIP